MKTIKRINIQNERYCHKCHKILAVSNFNKVPVIFKIAGVCQPCQTMKRKSFAPSPLKL